MSKGSEAVKKWRNSTKIRMVESMGGKCSICGYNKCKEALEFHHIDPTEKEFSFGKTLANPTSWDRLVKELEKCILLCANCHREIHNDISEIPENYQKFNISFSNYRKTFVREMDHCSVCNKLKSVKDKYCSQTCASYKRRKLNWNDYDLVEMHKTLSYVKIGKILGVSEATIRKYISLRTKQNIKIIPVIQYKRITGN